jgi:hypothetical protein
VPEDVRRELDAILRRPPKERPSVEQMWHDMKFKERFNVSRNVFLEYARRVRAVQARAACGELVQALLALMEMPVDQSERLHTAGHLVLLGRLTQILQERELEPEQLVRVAEALSRQRTAVVRAQAQRLAHRKWLQAARAAPKGRRSIFDDPEELNRRVRMIYGIDMPTADPPPSSPPDPSRDPPRQSSLDGPANLPPKSQTPA